MGAGVARALGPHKAVLMRNHGVAVVGASVEEATILTILLDNAAQIQLLAAAAGGPGTMFEDDGVQRLHRNVTQPEQYTVNFEYLRRRIHRKLA
jgi:ribulose-5-phosphate 4-epimerase/fuculose-1-phosphate aldolase